MMSLHVMGRHHPSQRMASPRTAHPLHVRILLECFLVTIRNKVAARLHLSVILFTGGWMSASVHAGIHPLGQTPPGSTPPRSTQPPGSTAPRSTHPWKHTPPLQKNTHPPGSTLTQKHTFPPKEASPRKHTQPPRSTPPKHPHTHPEAHPPTVTAADGTHLVLFYSSLEMSLFM